MASSAELLRVLTVMANELAWLAIGWHLVLAVLLVAVLTGWRPSARIGALMMVGPALSVAVAALAYGNPFNAASFALLALALAAISGHLRRNPLRLGPRWAGVLGLGLIAYGWGYPHFLAGSWVHALYAAPVGIVPCPTLAILAGVALVAEGLGSRAVPAVLAAWTAFYAGFGIVRLGVTLDAGLLVAAVGLVALTVHNVRRGAIVPRAGDAIAERNQFGFPMPSS